MSRVSPQPFQRHHFRRNSLDALIKLKNNSVQQHSNSSQYQHLQRKSISSFDKIKIKDKSMKDLPTVRYQKEINDNIYFNPHSRTNYFKNLIDSYFVKNQQQINKNKLGENCNDNGRKASYLLRRSVINNKRRSQQGADFAVMQKVSDKTIKVQEAKNLFMTNKQFYNNDKILQKKEIQSVSLRYKQQHPIHHPQDRPHQNKSQNQQSLPSQIQTKNLPFEQTFLQQQSSFLPKITEAIDDFEDDFDIQPQQQFFTKTNTFIRSQSSFALLQNRKIVIFENNVVRAYITSEKDKKYKIKQFSNAIFLQRHKRAIQCGVETFWKPYKFNDLSLVTSFIHPLKNLLYRMVPHPTFSQQKIIHPKSLYSTLISNNCQQLFLMFTQLIKQMNRTSKKVINNNICLDNLYYVNGRLIVQDWEYAAFRDEREIQGNSFEKRVEPILRCEKEWLVEPEYLAPEILESVEDQEKQFDLWEKGGNLSDIYSLGVCFLEIITLVPMSTKYITSISSKPAMRPHKGFLCSVNRSPLKILEKQRSLSNRISLVLEREVEENERNDRFFSVLLRMIETNRAKRIKLEEILKVLS